MFDKQVSRRTFVGASTFLAASSVLAGQNDAMAEALPLEVRFGLNLLVYTATFSKDRVDLIRKVADMGYDGVEIPVNDLSILDPQSTRRACEASGMGLTSCAVLMPGENITSLDAYERKAGIERLKLIVDITAEMGGDTAAGPLYAPVSHLPGRGRTDEEWKWGVEGLRVAAEHAEKAKIFVAVEPLNRFETFFLNTAKDAVKLVKAVDHDNLKVQLDTFHGNIEEKDTAAAIRATGSYLGHFHTSESDRGVPGTGQVKWEECFSALREIDYKGWVTIESFAMGIVDLNKAACIWRPLYESADDLAVKGLTFLKGMVRMA